MKAINLHCLEYKHYDLYCGLDISAGEITTRGHPRWTKRLLMVLQERVTLVMKTLVMLSGLSPSGLGGPNSCSLSPFSKLYRKAGFRMCCNTWKVETNNIQVTFMYLHWGYQITGKVLVYQMNSITIVWEKKNVLPVIHPKGLGLQTDTMA